MRTPTFADLLRTEVAALQAATPEHEGAIARAHALITQGSVHPMGAGEALVRSSDDPTRWYEVNGTCSCPAGTHGQICKHRSAWLLYQRVQKKWQKAEAQHLLLAELTYDPDIEAEEEREPLGVPVEPQSPALPEAPASVNCYLMLEGRQVQLTLRDTDEARLLQRLATILQQYPAPPLKARAQGNPQAPQEDWCRIHTTAMKINEKNGRTWYSHRMEDGTYCQGRTKTHA